MSALTGTLLLGTKVLPSINSIALTQRLTQRLPSHTAHSAIRRTSTVVKASMMDLGERDFVRVEPPEDVLNAVRRKDGKFAVFWDKCKRAWAIFFPPTGSPGNKRLQMVLLAERASLPPENLDMMKASIVDAMREYVEVDDGEEVTVSFSTDPVSGIVYCVAVPVRNVMNDLEMRDINPEEHGDFIEEPDMPFWDKTGEARYPYGF